VGKLVGHSGCYLHLTKENLVVKTSSNYNYNERLELQAKKQEEFEDKWLKTPNVKSKQYYSGFFSFTMTYIPGNTMALRLLTRPFPESLQFIDKVIYFLNSNLNKTKGYENKQLILNKLDSIRSNFSIPEPISNWIIEELENAEIPSGYCHGDFTLENMIVYDKEIYLLDFLDSYIESPLQDISKLFQDIYGLWSFRNMDNLNFLVVIRLKMIKEYLIKNLNISNEILKTIDILAVMNFLRIIPYTKDQNLIRQLITTIEKIIAQWK